MSINLKPAAVFVWDKQELFAVFEDSWRIRVAFLAKPEGEEKWQCHCIFRDGYALYTQEGAARYEAERFVTQWWNRIAASATMAVT